MHRRILVFTVLTIGCAMQRADHGRPGALARSGESPTRDASTAAGSQPTPRLLIRRGGVDVTVERVNESRRRFERAVANLGGQVARLDLEQAKRADYLVRVPPDRLDALIDSAAVLGRVGKRTVSAEDVTDRVVDTEARLSVLRASRDRLKLLMDRAASVSDVVTVERELARVQAEIESLEARLNALRGYVTLSELSVRIERRIVLGPLGLLAQGIGTIVQKLFIWR